VTRTSPQKRSKTSHAESLYEQRWALTAIEEQPQGARDGNHGRKKMFRRDSYIIAVLTRTSLETFITRRAVAKVAASVWRRWAGEWVHLRLSSFGETTPEPIPPVARLKFTASGGGWRREWDSDSRTTFVFCSLQMIRCQECQGCRGCRRPLHAIARQQSLAPFDSST
jgi:hypothetical protein